MQMNFEPNLSIDFPLNFDKIHSPKFDDALFHWTPFDHCRYADYLT